MNLEVPKPPDDEKKENKKYKRVPVYTKKIENNQPKKQVSNIQKDPNKNIGGPVVPIFVVILTIFCIINSISNQKTPEQIRAEEAVKGDFGRW